MGLERIGYRYEKIYIEASRILDPQFNEIALVLTGAQVELLRNATMLFHSQDTFVDAYHDGYYLNASDADYDEIQAIVADLERLLMGENNMLWVYNDVYREDQSNLDVGTPSVNLTFGLVPAGEVWVITQWMAVNEDTRTTNNTLLVSTPQMSYDAAAVHPDAPSHRTGTSVFVPVKALERVEIRFEGCTEHDIIHGFVTGYKVNVST